MHIVDINCDMGESFGAYQIGSDEDILDFITSANIACGYHAGDPTTMRKTVQLALEKNVGLGVHPGLPDLVGFGRRNMQISPQEAYDLVVYQIGSLYAFAKSEGGTLQHVKPHGALFNMAAKSAPLSEAIAEAIYKVDPELIMFGLAGSELIKAGKKIGLRTASEVFSDRTYQEDGSLTSRREANALIKNHEAAVNQVIRMVKKGKVTSLQGTDISIQADTICIHGDGEHALEFAQYITKALKDAGILVRKISEIV
ncbi:LamB/YcsF family protein [Heyndrickxia ginsengihumi]|uniref:5-oxoprolinase subunit A n=1 Tax=Heyndrickxia ginsengihumi TaxID=363870 RepID=A0A0A6XYC7_9BACI|nr:5-oxoprolinase subunit PxpA [Heyndrickxia ginsengihumi]KHD85157.1 LamB/YcsF family protein [Heyndrickxia ginsengihumi]MBE6184537.1 LamB/YcsF family protein [Bacillus sp. (in: firmicutes)]MCM3023732.1 LamB/YcsF family protein [Heyndrickxia ginsengihumi]NEY19370.1 LamB/YcsF family protein [Heyndrickxia ginsengihumi]